MKVKLVTSPHVRHPAVLQGDFALSNNVMYTFAPVGLLSLIGAVRKRQLPVECSLFDFNRHVLSGSIGLTASFYDDAAERLCDDGPDVVGFMTECDSYHHILQVADAVKKRNADTRVILGGPHASVVSEHTLRKCSSVDAIVVGEGEETFPELLDTIGEDRPVAGCVRRFSTGEIVNGGPRALIEDLDGLPFPAFDLYSPDAGEELFLEVGRGCPFQCTFCSTAPYWRRRHRTKSASRILQEVALLRDRFGVVRTHFTHDLFTTNRAWVDKVCDALVQAKNPVSWTCSARTDTVDDELLSNMARAGCAAIYFGIESGSQRILKEIRKDIPVSHSLAVLDACERHGIKANAGLIVGFPSEDAASFGDTMTAFDMALRTGCRPTHLFAYCPFA